MVRWVEAAACSAGSDNAADGGGMAERIASFDWGKTPLGPREQWPQSLRTVVRIMLSSRFAMWMAWGEELTFLCNDAYLPTVGLRKDWVLGARSDKVWAEIWTDIGPRIRHVLETGEATWDEALLLFLERSGFPEETYHTFSYSPLADDSGKAVGMLCVVTEETERLVGERRLRILGELGAGAKEALSAEEACRRAGEILGTATPDVPFALCYLVEPGTGTARLMARANIPAGHPLAPDAIEIGDVAAIWPLDIANEPRFLALDQVAAPPPGGPWQHRPAQAVVLPLGAPGQAAPAGYLACGINPRRPLDEPYLSFFELAAGHVATAVVNARAYETERRRAEALAELDQAKTSFFSNVSHEFRTPLTLMLGPLEEVLNAPGRLAATDHALIAAAHRNGQRLLRLVNTLLDFTRVEANRAQALYAPTDLPGFTAEIVSAFQSACASAGLRLELDLPPLPEPIFVDRAMWEKIVLNLVSNAFKFTFEGGISVSLRLVGASARLTVQDTGTGIPPDELPHIFNRFHRVAGAQGRSHEGSGIGLALVRELVRLHGGEVAVDSAVGRGSSFTVTLPRGSAHLPSEALAQGADPAATASPTRAGAFVEEARRWLPDTTPLQEPMPREVPSAVVPAPMLASSDGSERPAHVLVADDNVDMRAYLRRLLLGAGYTVELAPNGAAALASALTGPPDLVLTDVMMPKLDGFGLLRALRDAPRTRDVPVLMLSARAGEEAGIEGLDAGADDYLVKPFSARELLARVGTTLRLVRMRQEVAATRHEAETRWRNLVESMQEGFAIGEIITDSSGTAIDFRYVEVNRAWEALTGLPPEAVTGQRATESVPGLDPPLLDIYARVVETGTPAHVEGLVAPLQRHYSVSVYRIGPGRFGALFLDITERRRFAEQQRLLAHEVDHRAKNALSVVQSVVRLSRSDTIADFVAAIEGRVEAIARAHSLLADDQWRGAGLRSVVERELDAYDDGECDRIVSSGPDLRLAPAAVQPLSMVLHELATNAAKYGALSVPAGRLALHWWRDPATGLGHLQWEERDGPAIADAPARSGFGSTLISALTAGQLGGQAELDWRPTGLVCRFTLAADIFIEPEGSTPPGPGSPGPGGGTASVPPGSLRGKRILVVEDETLVAMELEATLTALGCVVVGPAATLEAGLRLATHGAGLAAAVLDLNLRGQSAVPIAEKLRAQLIPVIWTTGYTTLPAAVTADAAHMLRKPVRRGELEATLRQLLATAPSA